MTNANVDVNFSKRYSYLSIGHEILAYGPKINNLFAYTMIAQPKHTDEHSYYSKLSESTLWHHRLAHTNYQTIERMSRLNSVKGIPKDLEAEPSHQCSNCPFGKQSRAPFKKTEASPPEIGDIIVSDVCGPFETSIGGYRYFITWIDFKSRYVSIEFIKNKECSTVTDSFKRYIAWITRQKNANVKKIRTDNGGEYMGSEFQHICGELGIIHETTAPYTPEYNGLAERYNRTLQEGALTLQHDSQLSGKFWVSAIHTVNFVRNRVLHSRLGMSPYESFWGVQPRVDWLRTYGSKCWVLIPKAIRKKGEYRSIEGIFVGYFDNSRAYKVWIPRTHTIMKTRDAIFDESNQIERVTIDTTDEDDDVPELWRDNTFKVHYKISTPPASGIEWTEEEQLPFAPSTVLSEAEEKQEKQQDHEKKQDEHEHQVGTEGKADEEPRPGYEPIPETAPKEFSTGTWLDPENMGYGRGKRHQALFAYMKCFANTTAELEMVESAFMTLAEDEPSSFKEAMNSPDHDKWMKACKDEYDLIMGYRTWDLVPVPNDVNVVGNRWTFRVKRDNLGNVNRYKARMVAQGFSQIQGIDFNETYSPTIRLTSIRLILALACFMNLELRQIDVKGAYLNGIIEEDVYMRQPEGFIVQGKEDMVCKLNKGVYGLKQSGRVWHQTLKRELEKIGFKPGDADPSVFFRYGENNSIEIAGWYVDDGLLAANSTEAMDRMVHDIKGSFDIQDLGVPERLLGIRIIRNRELGTIHISQPSFIDTIAKRFNISPGKRITSPMLNTIDLRISTTEDETINIPYASLIGSINYCSIFTRPDISYATNKCAQFTSKPTSEHWEAAKRIVRYLVHTKNYGIKYKSKGLGLEGFAHNLAGFTDADFAGDVNDRKSTSGWLFTYNNAPISWNSKKQHIVTRSTMEAELVAGSFASAEGIWLLKLGKDFHLDFRPIPIFTDNKSFILFSKNDINNNRTKHIDTHYHYTRNQITEGNIELFFIPTSENPADILTKALGPNKHKHVLTILGLSCA